MIMSPVSLMACDGLYTPALRQVLDVLNRDGAVTRLVGGCVRNALLGFSITDTDLATTLLPDMTLARLAAAGIRACPTGLAHGTVTAVCDGQSFEITTLRRDVTTDGRRATVAFTDDWVEDARRRDFTMNALYADADGVVHDPLAGLPDVLARRVRFIGDPLARIREDGLRILRYFRFIATLQPDSVPLDPASLAACGTLAAHVTPLSGERIQGEMLRLLATPHPLRAVAAMADAGVLAPLGLSPEKGAGGKAEGEAGSAWGGLAPATGAALRWLNQPGLPVSPLVRLYVLAGGDQQRLMALATRWALSRQQRDHLLRLARTMYDAPDLAVDRVRWQVLDALPLPVFSDALMLFCARSHVGTLLPGAASVQYLGELLKEAARLKEQSFPLSGDDLLRGGLPKGPVLGQHLRQARQLWAQSGFVLSKREILDKIINNA
jgi:poly(A) polymerase